MADGSLRGSIVSQRLVLEPLLGSHAELLFEGLTEPQLYRWISTPIPQSVEVLRRHWIAVGQRGVGPGGERALQWAARRASDGRYVGKLDADVVGTVATNVGYIILLPFWNQGYATEAVWALAAYLEGQGISEQRALVTLGNQASARVMRKAGFEQTRIIPDNDTIRGQKHDDVEFVRRASSS